MENFIIKMQQLSETITNDHQTSIEFVYKQICEILVEMNIAKIENNGLVIKNNQLIYYSHYFENNLNSKTNLIGYIVDYCDKVITEINSIHFAKSFESLVLAIFPEGHYASSKAIKYQQQDYNLTPNGNQPSLEKIKESKELLISKLISKLTSLGYISLAIKYHKKYRAMFFIGNDKILSYFNQHSKFETLDIDAIAYLKELTSNDLANICNPNDYYNARNTILKFIDSLENDDKKNLQSLTVPINLLQDNVYNELKNATTVEQIKEAYNKISTDLHIINDNFRYLINPNNQNALKHLSVFQREYLRIFDEMHNNRYLSLKSFDEFFDNIISKKLQRFADTLSEDEQQDLLKHFCQSGIDWLNEFPNSPTPNYLTEKHLTMCKTSNDISFYETALFSPIRNSKNIITFDNFYNSLNQMPVLKKIVIAAQNRIQIFEQNANFIDGDYTWLVCTQIKLIERYLKLVILHNNWRLNKTNKNHLKRDDNGNLCYFEASANTPNIIDDVEIGGIVCGLQYRYYTPSTRSYSNNIPWFIKGYYYNRNRNTTTAFHPQSTDVTNQCPLYLSFTQGFRNGFFHVEPVKDFETAKNISKGVAYWLACCMQQYGVVQDIET